MFGNRLTRRKRGGIILMSSLVGWQGVPQSAHYAATKAYVQSLAEALRFELKPQGVDVLASAPGPVNSGFAARADMRMGAPATPASVAKASIIALGRKGTVLPGGLTKLLTYSLLPLPRSISHDHTCQGDGRDDKTSDNWGNRMTTVGHGGRIVELPGPYGRVLRTLDRQKQKMLDTVEGYSPEWLTYSPSPDAWSILQLFDHLMRTERAVRETAARNLALSMPRPTLRERWRALYLLGVFLFPTRVRIPKAVSFVVPEQPESLGALAAQSSSERELLRQFLLKKQPSALRETAMRHPAVGAMTLRTALRFLVVHLWHRQFQMFRLRWAITWMFL